MDSRFERWQRLVEKAQEADHKAYSEFLSELSVYLGKTLQAKIRADQERDDVMQNILIGVDKALMTYDKSRPFKSWLWAIIRYKCIDYFREQSLSNDRFKPLEFFADDDFAREHPLSAEDELLFKQEASELLGSLKEREKDVLLRSHVYGFSLDEIAVEMNLSLANVKVISHRALKTLRGLAKKKEAKSS